jgi:hypothetical protein
MDQEGRIELPALNIAQKELPHAPVNAQARAKRLSPQIGARRKNFAGNVGERSGRLRQEHRRQAK